MMFAKIKETKHGYAIEFTNNIGEHVDWFTKNDESIKTWPRIEGAQRTMEKYGWLTK